MKLTFFYILLSDEYPGPNHYNITLPCRPDGEKVPEFSMGQAAKKGNSQKYQICMAGPYKRVDQHLKES